MAINSAPTEGVKAVPLSQVKATFPVLKNPTKRRRAVGFTFEQWHYAFANTFSEAMTARDAVELCRLVRPRTVVPVHYEGWAHFEQGREAVERELAGAPEEIRRQIRWLPIGVPTEIGTAAGVLAIGSRHQ